MKRPLTRLGLTMVGAVGLLAAPVSPASARTSIKTVFVAQVTLDEPLSYRCSPPGTTDLCTTTPTLETDLWSGPGFVGHFDYDHNARAITSVAAGLCLELLEVNVLEEEKEPFHILGSCSFQRAGSALPDANTVSGNCGEAGGQVTLDYQDAVGQDFLIDLHFNVVAGFVAMVGTAVKPTGAVESGVATGTGIAIPFPETMTPPSGNSCANKTATVFTIFGLLSIVTAF
jgi:hypothetical protein